MIKSLIKEYGIMWLFHRFLYALKLKGLIFFPMLESLFEKKIEIKRIDIYKCKNIKNLENFLNELSEKERIKIIKEADKILEGKLKTFSSLELDYGSPIEWNKNPLTNEKFSLEDKWYKIPDFDKKKRRHKSSLGIFKNESIIKISKNIYFNKR